MLVLCQVLNPVLVLVLVPVMERWGYPFLERLGLLTTALQRVAVGGLLAAMAFATAAVVEWNIEVEPEGETSWWDRALEYDSET